MSIEAGVLIGRDGEPIYWHLPEARTGGSLPDSRELWNQIWEHRDSLLGFAHSHPGRGATGPSWTDITTFAGVEAALGKRLYWWIITEDWGGIWMWVGPNKQDYRRLKLVFEQGSMIEHRWLETLRQHSNY